MKPEGIHPGSGAGKEETPSLAALYREHNRLVRSVAFRIAGPSDPDDIVQETFIRIWRGLGKFKNEANVKTWIYRVAVNTAIDHHRKNRKRKIEVVLPPEVAGDDPSIEKRRRSLIQKGLAALSDRHRAVLVLHAWEGLSVEEIAGVLGTWKGTVKSRLFYARKGMFEFLRKNGEVL